jgi:hypothetical protein
MAAKRPFPPDAKAPRRPRNLALRPQAPEELAGAALITPTDVLRAQTRWDVLAPVEAKGLLDATSES